jgi:hypothetical protein
LVFFDLAKDFVLITHDLAQSGSLGMGTAAGLATSVAVGVFTHWLSKPATAASMSAWSRALSGIVTNPTPARIAIFNIATRNMANNLGVPAERIAQSALARLKAPAEEPASPGNRKNP